MYTSYNIDVYAVKYWEPISPALLSDQARRGPWKSTVAWSSRWPRLPLTQLEKALT